jgi:preprotein translocase subunit SecB
MADENNNAGQQQQFALQRIYIKDMSFESPQGVKAFTQQWKPQVKMDLNTRHEKIDDSNYEVVLTLTITASQDEEVAFLIELQQAGVFFCKGLQGAQLGQVLGALCPGILFPYARETVDSIVTKGSFPALMLAPVNFDALYQQALTQQQQKQKEAAH